MNRLAIIGTDYMVMVHTFGFRAVDGVELIATCDVDEARLSAFADGRACRHWQSTSVDALLADGDIDCSLRWVKDSWKAFTRPVSIWHQTTWSWRTVVMSAHACRKDTHVSESEYSTPSRIETSSSSQSPNWRNSFAINVGSRVHVFAAMRRGFTDEPNSLSWI